MGTNSEKIGSFSATVDFSILPTASALWIEVLMDRWMAFPIACINDRPVHSRMRITVYQAVWRSFDFPWSPNRWFAKIHQELTSALCDLWFVVAAL